MDLRTWTFPVSKKLRTSVVFRRSAVRTALVIAATISILLWAFSATWLRPLIKYTVAERSGRSIDFDELHIRFNSSLDPTVEFRGLMIQNATWAASRPLVRAGMVSFTFSWRTLFAEQVVIQRLVLLDAEVDLERQADGLRNWRLIHPDDRGPQRVKVLEVDAMRSAVHVVHRGIDLEVDTRVSALAPARTLAAYPKLPLTKWLVFRGSLGGTSFEGEVALSDVLTFGDTSSRFAVVGKAKVGATLVEAEGVASDVQSSADFDLDLRLSSNSLGELWPLPFANAIEEVQPVFTEAHVNKTGSKWTASRLRGTIGHTDFTGDLTFNDEHSAVDRPAYRATLRSKVVDVNDISPLMAMFSSSNGKAGSAAGALLKKNLIRRDWVNSMPKSI